MSQVLRDKVAIITGAGRGLGKEFALRFAGEGAKLLLPDIGFERSEKVAQQIQTDGGEAVAMQADISDENSTVKIAEKVMELYGRVDILLNNAAIYYGLKHQPWDEWKQEDWDRIFAVNVRGTWQVCKTVAPLMVKQSRGKIINIASDVFRVPGAHGLLPYAVSKAAVHSLTQCLARALGPAGINVNAIGPGLTATEASLLGRSGDDVFAPTIEGQCLKRREEPQDLVGTAVFLASDDSDFITGQLIFVNGGHVML
jgi:3-oxoacyl-[acyl-carrier protein] reductase